MDKSLSHQKNTLSGRLKTLDLRLGQSRLPFYVIVVLVVFIGLPLLFYPFGRDQGIHGYVAASWLEGRLPYKDVWVQKGPLAYLPHMLVISVFGRTEWAIRLLDLIWQIVISWLIYRLARRRLSGLGALLAVFFYLLLYFAIDFWNTSHTEGFLLPFLLLAVEFYDRARRLPPSRKRRALFFLSGFTVAVTPWFKQTSLVFVAAIFLWMTIDAFRDATSFPRSWLNRVVPFGAGAIAFTLLMTLFVSSQGILTSMLDVLRYSVGAYPSYGPLSEISAIWQATFAWTRQRGALVLLFLIGLGLVILQRRRRHEWLGITILAIAGLLGVYAQRRLWEYHWISTLPFIALIAAATATVIVDSLFKSRRAVAKWLIIAAAGVLIFVLSAPLLETHVTSYARLVRHVYHGLDIDGYRQEIGMRVEANAAEYLRRRSEQNDSVFVWGHYALLYYLTDRRNPTRFAMDPPLSLKHPQQDDWQADTMLDLNADPPQYILVATGDVTPFEPQPSKQQLANFPELAKFIEDAYYLAETIPGFDVHIRRTPPDNVVNAALGDGITLEGYALHSLNVKPGGEVAITLHWRAQASPDFDYTVFVHLVDWSIPRIVSQSDSYPAQGRQPTSAWQPGDLVLDTHSLTLPADLSGGQYELIVGMYRLDTMERLPVIGEDRDYIPFFVMEHS